VRWLLRFVGLRRFRDGKLRTSLTILGIAAGVSSLIATGAANEAILKGFRSTMDAVGGDSDLAVTTAVSGELDEDVADKVRAVPGVQSATPGITEIAKLPDGSQLYVFGVDMAAGDDTKGLNAFQNEGADAPDPMEFLNDPDACLVSKRFAAEHGLKVGDRFPLLTPSGRRDLHVRGLLQERGPAKAFGGQVAVMDIYNAETAFGRGKHIDRVDIKKVPGVNEDELIARIQKVLGPGPQVGPPERKGKSIEMMLRSFQIGLYMGSSVSLLVGLFLVFNTMSFAVTQRRREIGTLRALGVPRVSIAALFAIEAAVYGTLGSVLGIFVGKLLARVTVAQALRGVNDAYMSVSVSDANVSRTIMLLGLAMGVGGSVIASLIPSIEAARVPPVDALRRDRMTRVEKKPTLQGRFLGAAIACVAIPLLRLPLINGAPIFGNIAMGAIVLGAALTAPTAIDLVHAFLAAPISRLFGAPGRVALAGMARARRRSGVAAGAVLIGISLVLCLDTFVGSFRSALSDWMNHSIPADLFVTQGANTIGILNTPMDQKVGALIEQVPGVAEVQPVRLVWTDFRGARIGVYAIDWGRYSRHSHPIYTEGDTETSSQRIIDGGVLISDNLARKQGIHAGDQIALPTSHGPQNFPVVAVGVDYSSDRGVIMMDRAVFIRLFGDDKVDSFDTYLKAGADLPSVRRALDQKLTAFKDVRIFSNAELRASIFSIIDDFFALVYALLFIAIAVGVLGVVGTLLAQVLDRTREIGILRAMGASRGQILLSVSIEASLLALAGALLGVPVGFLMGRVFVEVIGVQATGWVFPETYSLWFGLLSALVSIAFAGLGGLFPARRAAGLDVVEAIGYE
jgi:putative ABC transport system permease protein